MVNGRKPNTTRAQTVLTREVKGKAESKRSRTVQPHRGVLAQGHPSSVELDEMLVSNPRRYARQMLQRHCVHRAIAHLQATLESDATSQDAKTKASDLTLKYSLGDAGAILLTATKQQMIELTVELFAEWAFSPANLPADQAVAEFAIRLQERLRDLA